jgi:predicted lipoprotein with Yx(FWY)xxD motif
MQVMTFCKRAFLSVIPLMLMIIISGCASGANAPTTTQSIPTIPPASTTQSIPTVAPTTSTTSNVVIKTATATVDAKAESILTDVKGMTLYYFKPDVLHKVACTSGCIDTWPPVLFKGTGTVSADTKLPGDLTTDNTVNGNQVVYNGHYLYTYGGDSAPGQTNGQGIASKWYVVTPDLK